jgi:hypothetical protein
MGVASAGPAETFPSQPTTKTPLQTTEVVLPSTRPTIPAAFSWSVTPQLASQPVLAGVCQPPVAPPGDPLQPQSPKGPVDHHIMEMLQPLDLRSIPPVGELPGSPEGGVFKGGCLQSNRIQGIGQSLDAPGPLVRHRGPVVKVFHRKAFPLTPGGVSPAQQQAPRKDVLAQAVAGRIQVGGLAGWFPGGEGSAPRSKVAKAPGVAGKEGFLLQAGGVKSAAPLPQPKGRISLKVVRHLQH